MEQITMNLEQYLIWGLALLLGAVLIIPYVIRSRYRQRDSIRRHKEARELGIDRARAQYPIVNPGMCIGCGTCVDACPEHDVMAVIHGTAVVVNGIRCVGHGLCELACPVGALTVGLGDISSRDDIPVLSPVNESSVPGLFIAGELSGQSLIRNAIDHGRMAIEEIARRREMFDSDVPHDVIIVGAGPAGLSAALAAKQYDLRYVVLDESDVGGTVRHYPRRKLVMTQPVDIPLYGKLNRPEYTKEHLIEIWHDIVSRFSLNILTGRPVSAIHKPNGHFTVTSSDGEQASRFVVLAMGRRGSPRKLGVPGEQSEKVMYQLTDAQSYTNSHILVVGGGDSAVEAAAGLAHQPGNVVHVSYRKSGFFRVKKKNETQIGELIKSKAVTPVFESQVKEITPDSVILTTPNGDTTLKNDYVFVFIGGTPPFGMLKNAGIRFGGDKEDALPACDAAAHLVLPT